MTLNIDSSMSALMGPMETIRSDCYARACWKASGRMLKIKHIVKTYEILLVIEIRYVLGCVEYTNKLKMSKLLRQLILPYLRH